MAVEKANTPILSIVTVVYNGVDNIETTIQCVASQKQTGVEYLVVDGGSKDGTLDIIRKYSRVIDRYISEKDNGIYDAMNKGVALASGEWVYFLNCGDLFIDSTVLNKIMPILIRQQKSAIVYGNVEVVTDIMGKRYISGKMINGIQEFLFGSPICHQAAFVNRRVLQAEGMFNLDYKIIADNVSFYNIIKKVGVDHVQYLNIPVAQYHEGGTSFHSLHRLYYERLLLALKAKSWYVVFLYVLGYPGAYIKNTLVLRLEKSRFRRIYRKIKLVFLNSKTLRDS